jgi:hypothetical protein
LHDIQKAALIDEKYLKPKKLKTLYATRACKTAIMVGDPLT